MVCCRSVVLTARVDEVHQLTAIALNSVTIDCYNHTRSRAPPRRVDWLSHAWSPTRYALRIFSSHDNAGFSVEPRHPNADNYAVDDRYRLTIGNVSIEHDPGLYVCRVTAADTAGRQHDYQYQLSVAGERGSNYCGSKLRFKP